MYLEEVRAAVEAEFSVTGVNTPPWPDPHPDDARPGDDEYSRLLDPGKYRILGARIEAWLRTFTALRIATVTEVDDPRTPWRDGPPEVDIIARARWARPRRSGAVPLLVCTSGFGGPRDNGLVLGAGEPAVLVELLPVCGCDACDDGSDELLEELDDAVADVVSGAFAHVTTRQGTVQGKRDGSWSASGHWKTATAERLLAEARAGRSAYPAVHGTSWW